MADINRVTLLGRSGADAELKHTPKGTAVLNLSIATSEKRSQTEPAQWDTTWHRVIIWSKRAEMLAPKVKKGSVVFIDGKIQIREWQDSTGNKHQAFEIIAVHAADVIDKSKPETSQVPSNTGTDWVSEEDIPF